MTEEIIYMIGGEDENGDQHAVFTNDLARAIEHYDRMGASLSNVRGNAGFEDRAMPYLRLRDGDGKAQ